MEQDKISVGLELDTSEYKKGIKDATQTFDDFQNHIEEKSQIQLDISKLENELKKYENLVEKTKKKIDKITEGVGKTSYIKAGLENPLTGYGGKEYTGEEEVKINNNTGNWTAPIKGQEEAFNKLQDELTNYENKIIEIYEKIGDLTAAENALKQSTKEVGETGDKVSKTFTGWKNDIFYMNGQVLGVRKKAEETKEEVEEEEKSQKKVTEEVKKTNKEVRKTGKETKRNHASMFNISSLIRRIGLSIRRQIVTQIASALNPLNMMKKAFSYLTDTISPRLGATFKNIGNNLTEYFANSPLFKNMIDQLLYLIKVAQDGYNVIAKLFGFRQIDLFKTSKKTAKEIEKSASHTVASFDEINDIGNQQQNNDNVPLGLGELNLEDKTPKIIEGINNLIKKFKEFFSTFDFENLGKKIADLFTHLFTDIDWPGLAETIIIGLTGVIDTIWSFVRNADWGKIGKTLSDTFIGAISKLKTWLKKIDWNKLASDLFLAFYDLVINIDWNTIISDTFEVVGNLLGGATTLVANLVTAVGVLIVDYFNQYLTIDSDDEWYEIGGKVILAIIKGIGAAFIDTKKWMYEYVYLPLAAGILNAFGVKVNVDQVRTLFKKAFTWENIKTAFNSLKDNFAKLFDNNGAIGKYFTSSYWKSKLSKITFPKIKLTVEYDTKASKAKLAIAKALGMDGWPKLKFQAYKVGTNYVPYDQLAYLHEGEAVIPKKFNDKEYFGGTNDETNALLETLIDRVENLELSPYITVKDIGQASLNYINNKSRITGRSVI